MYLILALPLLLSCFSTFPNPQKPLYASIAQYPWKTCGFSALKSSKSALHFQCKITNTIAQLKYAMLACSNHITLRQLGPVQTPYLTCVRCQNLSKHSLTIARPLGIARFNAFVVVFCFLRLFSSKCKFYPPWHPSNINRDSGIEFLKLEYLRSESTTADQPKRRLVREQHLIVGIIMRIEMHQ